MGKQRDEGATNESQAEERNESLMEELDEQQLEQMSGGATIPVRRKKVPPPGWYEC